MAHARIAELEAGLKLAAADMQRATDEMGGFLSAKGARIIELTGMLNTVTNHLETANEWLLSEGLIEVEEDYADEKTVIQEARDLAGKHTQTPPEEDGSKAESPV